jgi:hypothetical protein
VHSLFSSVGLEILRNQENFNWYFKIGGGDHWPMAATFTRMMVYNVALAPLDARWASLV